jgi:hypothetical protein
MERACFHFCTRTGEYLTGKQQRLADNKPVSLFYAVKKATGSSPPLEGIGSKISSKTKGGVQGVVSGLFLILPVSCTL